MTPNRCERAKVLKNLPEHRIAALFGFFVLCEFIYGSAYGSLFSYFELEAKSLGLSNSKIETFLGFFAVGGILSGLLYTFLLNRFNKERVFLVFSFITSFSLFSLGAFVFIGPMLENKLVIDVVFSFLTFGIGLGRCAILNFGFAFAAEAYPETLGKKVTIIYGSFMIGMSIGPVLLLPFYSFFGYSSVFISLGVLLFSDCVVIFLLAPNYPPELQKEKAQSLESSNTFVQVSTMDILKQPVVLKYVILYTQLWTSSRIMMIAYSLYLSEEFEMSDIQVIFYTNIPYIFGCLTVFLSYILLSFFKPISTTFWFSVIATLGFFLFSTNLFHTKTYFLLAMIGACMITIGVQLSTYATKITLELTLESLDTTSNYAIRDSVVNIISTCVFIGSLIGSVQASFESLFMGFEWEMVIEGLICAFCIGLFYWSYYHFMKERKMRLGEAEFVRLE